MQKTYYLDPKKLAQQTRGIILLYVITGVVTMVLIYLLQTRGGQTAPPWLLLSVIPFLLVFVGAGSIQQRKLLWDRYSLTLEDGVLHQSQPNYPDSKIALTSVTSIEETKEGLYLSSRQGKHVFGIPRQLRDEDFEELRLILNDDFAKRDEKPAIEEENEVDNAADHPARQPGQDISAVIKEAEGIAEPPEDLES